MQEGLQLTTLRSENCVGRIKKHLANGTFSPIIDRIYNIDNIVEAFQYVETGEKVGNVVIKIH